MNTVISVKMHLILHCMYECQSGRARMEPTMIYTKTDTKKKPPKESHVDTCTFERLSIEFSIQNVTPYPSVHEATPYVHFSNLSPVKIFFACTCSAHISELTASPSMLLLSPSALFLNKDPGYVTFELDCLHWPIRMMRCAGCKKLLGNALTEHIVLLQDTELRVGCEVLGKNSYYC